MSKRIHKKIRLEYSGNVAQDQPSTSRSGMHQETANAPSVSRQHQIEPHVQNPEQRAAYPCPIPFCKMLYCATYTVTRHLLNVHEGLHMFTCKSINCGFFSASEAERDEHELKEHRQYGAPSIAKVRCQICRRKVDGPIQVHIHSNHPTGSRCFDHPESICFPSEDEWGEHIVKCKENYAAIVDVSSETWLERTRKWICPLPMCDFGNFHTSGLHKHLKDHQKTRDIFTCDYSNCGNVYKSEAERNAHNESEHGPGGNPDLYKDNWCFFCDPIASFVHYIRFCSHIQYKHMNGNIPFTCENHINRLFFLTQEDKDAHDQKCRQMYQVIKPDEPKKPKKMPKKP